MHKGSRIVGRSLVVALMAMSTVGPIALAGGAGAEALDRPASAAAPAQRTLIDNGLQLPCGVAVDGGGNVYVTDSYNDRVLELPKGGTQITLPITGIPGPCAIAVDAAGDVFVPDKMGGRVIELPKGGSQITLPFTGLDTSYGIYGVAVDSAGSVYVADTGNSRIVKLTKAGVQTTVPINMWLPFGVAVDAAGNVYASEAYGGAVVELVNGGSQVALDFPSWGHWGLAVTARGDVFIADFRSNEIYEKPVGAPVVALPITGLWEPKGVAVDAAGDVFVADPNGRVVELPAGGTETTLGFTGLSGSSGVAVDAAGNVFVADYYKRGRVQKLAPDGSLTDLGFTGGDLPGGVAVDGHGNVFLVTWYNSLVVELPAGGGPQRTLGFSGLQQPAGVAVDGDGNVFVTDTGHARVVELHPNGVQTTVPFVGLSSVAGVAVDPAGNLFVNADHTRVVEMSKAGVQTTLGFTGLSDAGGVAVDGHGNVFALDFPNERVVELTAGGVQTTLGFTDIHRPWGLAVDTHDNVFVTPHAPSPGLVELPSAPTPSVPGYPSARPGDGSVTVSWWAPADNGSPITGYVVTPYVGAVAQPPRTFTSTVTSETLTGLTNGVAYTFRVAAINANGTGPPSMPTATVTAGSPGRPGDFLAADPGRTTATLRWWPPPDNGSPITAYRITPVRNGLAEATQVFDAANIHTVTGLTTGGVYSFRVVAVNARGQGPAAVTTASVGAPSAPVQFLRVEAGATSARVTWWAPPANGSAITGYVITPYIGWTAQAPRTFATPATDATITGLAAATSYRFRVVAVNAVGAGGAVFSPLVTTGTPASPTAAVAVGGPGQAQVSWTAPADNGSPIVGYVIIPSVNYVNEPPRTFNSTDTTEIVTGLTPGLNYQFRIEAINAVGTGTPSKYTNQILI